MSLGKKVEAAKEAVDTAGKAANIFERRPIGSAVVVMILSFFFAWLIMKGAISNAREDKKTAEERAERCDADYRHLSLQLLVKNNIINEQDKTIKVQNQVILSADSTIRQKTEGAAIKLLNKLK